MGFDNHGNSHLESNLKFQQIHRNVSTVCQSWPMAITVLSLSLSGWGVPASWNILQQWEKMRKKVYATTSVRSPRCTRKQTKQTTEHCDPIYTHIKPTCQFLWVHKCGQERCGWSKPIEKQW